MLVTIFSRALKDLLIPDIIELFFCCLLVYALGWWVLAWCISGILSAYMAASGGEGFILHMLGSAGGMIIAWFFFPLLYPILVSFFDDRMAAAIEREDYPGLPPALPPFWPNFMQDALFSLKAIGLNLLCLPLYFFPVAGAAVYYVLNGHLLGTQFFRMAAGRRVTSEQAEAMRKKARGLIFCTGTGISLCSTIPLLNLAAPLIGVASMLHLFHALRVQGR